MCALVCTRFLHVGPVAAEPEPPTPCISSPLRPCCCSQVRYGGQVLRSGAPLSSYGIARDSVLLLTPVEPANMSEFPDGSPLLSSPDHELYENWQQARAGLAEGQTPQLAVAGTGGSYFLQVSRLAGHQLLTLRTSKAPPMQAPARASPTIAAISCALPPADPCSLPLPAPYPRRTCPAARWPCSSPPTRSRTP